jgi:hypothetical protein
MLYRSLQPNGSRMKLLLTQTHAETQETQTQNRYHDAQQQTHNTLGKLPAHDLYTKCGSLPFRWCSGPWAAGALGLAGWTAGVGPTDVGSSGSCSVTLMP